MISISACGCGGKPVRCDLVVVPDAQRAPAHALRIAVVGKGEMVAGVEPAVVAAAQAVERPAFDH